jgi:hypothetical protein
MSYAVVYDDTIRAEWSWVKRWLTGSNWAGQRDTKVYIKTHGPFKQNNINIII